MQISSKLFINRAHIFPQTMEFQPELEFIHFHVILENLTK